MNQIELSDQINRSIKAHFSQIIKYVPNTIGFSLQYFFISGIHVDEIFFNVFLSARLIHKITTSVFGYLQCNGIFYY